MKRPAHLQELKLPERHKGLGSEMSERSHEAPSRSRSGSCRSKLGDTETDFYFKHTMPDITVFGHVCSGCIVLLRGHSVHCRALTKIRVGVSAELALTCRTNVLMVPEMKTFDEGLLT